MLSLEVVVTLAINSLLTTCKCFRKCIFQRCISGVVVTPGINNLLACNFPPTSPPIMEMARSFRGRCKTKTVSPVKDKRNWKKLALVQLIFYIWFWCELYAKLAKDIKSSSLTLPLALLGVSFQRLLGASLMFRCKWTNPSFDEEKDAEKLPELTICWERNYPRLLPQTALTRSPDAGLSTICTMHALHIHCA